MIDIHCHILHDIDDGPPSLEKAIEMLRAAKSDGIDTIIATPHFNSTTVPVISLRRSELSSHALQCGIKLLTGCEYTLSDFSAELEKSILVLGETSFVLVDLNTCSIPQFMEQLAFKAGLKGLRIILVHPEKLLTAKSLPGMIELHLHGVFFQVNAASINGKSGRFPQIIAKKMIAAGICDYIASDAHNMKNRHFEMKQAKSCVTTLFGNDAAETIFELNPQLLLQNKEPESIAFKPKSLFSSLWA
jgi:protein-tyrosine phosphatase